MTPERIEHFRELLETQRQALMESLEAGKDATRTVMLDQASVGRLSRMDAMQGQAMAIASQRRKEIRLQRIHAALTRIKSGDFGLCRDCEEEIAPGRLENDPAVDTCIACAAQREQR